MTRRLLLLALALAGSAFAEPSPDAAWIAALNSRGYESQVQARIGFDRKFAPVWLEEEGSQEGNQWTVRISFSKGTLLESFREELHSEGRETVLLRGCKLSSGEEEAPRLLPKRACDSLVLKARNDLEKWAKVLNDAVRNQAPEDTTGEEITLSQETPPEADAGDEQAMAQAAVNASGWNAGIPKSLWLHLRRKAR